MSRPILWSFRRCPYAMRARLAILEAGLTVELREILLRDKPEAFLDASPKGTVPVLKLPDGQVIEESLEIMDWALAASDPNEIAANDAGRALIEACQAEFKPHLDRYKYHTRYADATREDERTQASAFIWRLERQLGQGFLSGSQVGQTDLAVAPFVRQFANTDRIWFEAQDWSAVKAWLQSFEASDRFAAIMQKHPLWRPGAEGVAFP